jgi:hypothetical protein
MQTRVELIAPCAPGELFFHVSELDRYPQWMGGLVHQAQPLEDGDAHLPAWWVELRSRLGPLARSKKLRMVRTELVEESLAVFERRETDGRNHSTWRLRAQVTALEPIEVGGSWTEQSRLDMTLTYEGGLWTGGILEKVLQDQIERGRAELLRILTQPKR